ncbi:CapA family protein [Alkalibacillus aidingensis]|uniref:CapA family protein n=1 Tax=Alkalibacillus aidingensis TaxID=2747607 RepID=UPI002948C189|nr:CapA family protein [Alkalibacillus aidingensis]
MNKKLLVTSVSLTVLLVAMGVILILNLNATNGSELKKVYALEEPKFVDKEPRTVTTSLTLNAIGDILIHSPVYEDARTENGFDFTPMFEQIKPYLKNADITFANQESILGGDEIGLSSYPNFNSPYEVGDALKDAGVDIVSIANNHTIDRGEQAVINATNHLSEIGLEYVGGYQNEKDRQRKRIIHKNGISVGFLAYTYGTNGIPVPNGKDYLVNLIEEQQIIDAIHEMEEKTDFIVVSMHFGQEYHPLPNDQQIHLSELLTNEGADVILGHHPHVLQPVDWISTEEGHDRFVVYSLGNFLSSQIGVDRLIGAITQVRLTKTINSDTIQHQVSDAKVMPTYNYYNNHKQDFQIVPLIDADQYELHNAQQLYDQTEQHMQSFTDEVEIVPYLE